MNNFRNSIKSTGLTALFLATSMAACAQQSIPVPSRWQGQANVVIAGRLYTLPAVLDISAKGREESNPVRVFLGIGNQAQIGSCLLSSAQEMTTPYTLRQITVQYMNVQWGGSSFRATLANTQSDLGAVLSSFTTPNISAAYAPDYLKGMYSTMPLSTESYYFLAGSSFSASKDRGTLVGSVRGVGRSYTAIFSTPSVSYVASFRVSREQ